LISIQKELAQPLFVTPKGHANLSLNISKKVDELTAKFSFMIINLP